MNWLRALSFAVGLAMAVSLGMSVVATLVIPRGVIGRLPILVGRRIVRRFFVGIARRVRDYETQDRIFAVSAPTALLAVFAAWGAAFLLAYGLMIWALIDASFAEALRESGSSMLTLGFAFSREGDATAVHFLAAATGLFVVALEIAYLPTIYNAFNRRETLVTLLESRAGLPAWGPEVLARHQLVGIIDSLPDLYDEWERWAADVDETHTTYVILVNFRSPHPMRSWVVALLAVLDSAALYMSLSPKAAPSQARLCLRMGFTCLRSMANSFNIPYDPDPRPDDAIQLTYDEYLEGVARLEQTGFPMERTAEDAWPDFRGWRVNYEGIACALADQTNAVRAPWSGPRTNVHGEVQFFRPTDRTPDDPEGTRPTAQYKRALRTTRRGG